jgi:hypothetical protein
MLDGQRTTTANRRLAKKRVQWLNEALFFVPSFVLADSLVLRNRQLLVAAKRYASCLVPNTLKLNTLINSH